MTGPLQNVSPGQPLSIPADTWNAFIAVARDHRAQQAGLRGTFERGGRPPDTANVVIVQNGSGAPQDQFAVLGVDAPVILPDDNEGEFQRRVALSCVAPATAHAGRFVVLQEPLPEDGFGRAVVDGVTVVRVNVSDVGHTRAEVVDAQSGYLASGASGSAAIIWTEGGTGEQWAIVRLGASTAVGSSNLVQFALRSGATFSQSGTITVHPAYTTVGQELIGWDADGANVRACLCIPFDYTADAESFYADFVAGPGTRGNIGVIWKTGDDTRWLGLIDWDEGKVYGIQLTPLYTAPP